MQKPLPKPPSPSTSQPASWINSSILGIGLASLFSDMGHEMATAAMPALIASLGASSAVLGLIEGLSDGAASFAKLYSGLYCDRLERRKPLAIVGYFVTASAMASFAWAMQWWHVLLGRLCGWIARGVRTPVRKVLLTEATTPATYGRAFGLERAMDSAGAVLGPLMAMALLATVAASNARYVFIWTLVPGLLAALVIGLLVREKPHAPQPKAWLFTHIKALPGDFKRYLIGIGMAGLGDFSKTLLILWAAQAWTPSYGAARANLMAILFYVGYNAVYTVCCWLAGLLADLLPKFWVLAGGYSLAALPAAALLIPGDSLLKFGAVFGLSGLYMGVWETVESVTAATVLPRELRGTGFGLLECVAGVGDVASSVVVGALWLVSPTAAMAWVIVTSLVGAAAVFLTGFHAVTRARQGAVG
jgi:MFS family permease